MVVFLIDDTKRQVLSLLGVESFWNLPFFNGDMVDYTLNRLNITQTDERVVFGLRSEYRVNGRRYIESGSEAVGYLDSHSDENVLVLNSRICIGVDSEAFRKAKSADASFYMCDKNGSLFGYFCPAKFIRSYFLDNSIFDVFSQKISTSVFRCAEESRTLSSVNDYHAVHSLLLSSYNKFLPKVAEGIFVEGEIPRGDYVIVPPVYIGSGVQIENGAAVGPFSVVYDSVLIASDTTVRKTVVLPLSYVSRGCFLDGTICGVGVSVRRNSTVFGGSVIGASSLLSEESVVDSDTVITENSYLPFSAFDDGTVDVTESGDCVFYGFSAERTTRLGMALSAATDKGRVGVLGDGKNNSTALKLSLLGGLAYCGAECIDFGCLFGGAMKYYLDYYNLDFGVFVGGNDYGTVIRLVGRNKKVDKSMGLLIDKLMKGDSLTGCRKKDCKGIRSVHGVARIYLRGITDMFSDALGFIPLFFCGDPIMERLFRIALSVIGYKSDGNEIVFNINENGTNLSVKYNDRIYNRDQLECIVRFYKPQITDNSERWRDDAFYLSFLLMKIIDENKCDLNLIAENTPSVYVAEKVFVTEEGISSMASRISEHMDISYKNGCMKIGEDDIRVRFQKEPNNKKVRIFVKASSFAAADEIAADIMHLLEGRNS